MYLQKMLYDGNGGKTPKYKQGKKSPVWLPSHLPVYEMEADCFPVPENIKNKPKWKRVPNLMEQKKDRVGYGMGS